MKMIIASFLMSLMASAVLCSDVIELTDENFASGTKEEDIMLVEFYAPWCGHCKRLQPEYEVAATALRNNDPPVPLAKVDCTESGKETCGKYGVSGYPTLKIFRKGEFSQEYDGARESAGIIEYMQKNAGPSSKEIKDMESMNLKLEKAKSAIIFGFLDKDDDLQTEFKTLSDQMRNSFTFAHTTSEDVMAEMGHRDEMVIFRPKHLHSKLEDNKVVYPGSIDAFTMKKFLKDAVHGMVGHMTPSNEDQFKKPICVVYFAVDYIRNIKGTNYWRNRVLKVATQFKDRVMKFAIASKDDYRQLLESVGFDDKEEHSVLIRSDDGSKYKMSEKFSVDNFKAFLDDYFAGKLEPHVKSEDVPENNDGPVKVVVGSTFNEIVNDPTKDVLIEFYAPWCGHCKNLEPIYKELGEKLQDVQDVVIAKMDATANDAPSQYQVQGYPTIYFAPKNKKDSPVKYMGGRDLDSFVQYLQREATDKFELPSSDKKKKKSKKAKNAKDEL